MSASDQSPAWKLRTGLACAAVLIIASLLLNEGVRLAYLNVPAFAQWTKLHPRFANGMVRLLEGSLWLAVLSVFSRAGSKSMQDTVQRLGLARRPSLVGWLAGWAGLGVGLMTLYAVGRGWVSPNTAAQRAQHHGGGAWLFFAAYTVAISPLLEETVMRGFLYKSFRGSVGVAPSTALVLGVQTYFHWGLAAHDPLAFAIFLCGAIVLCVLREYTTSLWNCILFHSAYNATVVREWPLWITLMAVLLVVMLGSKGGSAVDQAPSDQQEMQ